MDNLDDIRMRVQELDAAESHGINVTSARAFWCARVVAWAKAHLPNDKAQVSSEAE